MGVKNLKYLSEPVSELRENRNEKFNWSLCVIRLYESMVRSGWAANTVEFVCLTEMFVHLFQIEVFILYYLYGEFVRTFLLNEGIKPCKV